MGMFDLKQVQQQFYWWHVVPSGRLQWPTGRLYGRRAEPPETATLFPLDTNSAYARACKKPGQIGFSEAVEALMKLKRRQERLHTAGARKNKLHSIWPTDRTREIRGSEILERLEESVQQIQATKALPWWLSDQNQLRWSEKRPAKQSGARRDEMVKNGIYV
uniref:Uncharacterized protein n=1 Tax=Trichuris muris TaxID=70415 RepID=A0A5S6R5M5_TRIMR